MIEWSPVRSVIIMREKQTWTSAERELKFVFTRNDCGQNWTTRSLVTILFKKLQFLKK